MIESKAMIRLVAILFFSLLSLSAKADGVDFDSYTWDFGKILEKDGIVSHTFVLTNNSKKDVLITSAVPSCSCTWVSYPKETIHPGEKGEVEVKYTPSGAVGKVFRDIQIFDYENKCIAMLEFTADVEPADRSIPEIYPYALAPFLYANIHTVPFGYVWHGTEKKKIIFLANSSDKPLTIKIESPDEKLQLKYPETLQAGEEVELEMTYHTPLQEDYYEFVMDTLRLTVDGNPAHLPITTSMVALSKIEPSDAAPTLRTYPSSPGLKKKGKAYRAQVEVCNDGDVDLEIKALQFPEGVTANIGRGERIGKGRKRILELTSRNNEGFKLCIFTNDPVRPMKEIRINPLIP